MTISGLDTRKLILHIMLIMLFAGLIGFRFSDSYSIIDGGNAITGHVISDQEYRNINSWQTIIIAPGSSDADKAEAYTQLQKYISEEEVKKFFNDHQDKITKIESAISAAAPKTTPTGAKAAATPSAASTDTTTTTEATPPAQPTPKPGVTAGALTGDKYSLSVIDKSGKTIEMTSTIGGKDLEFSIEGEKYTYTPGLGNTDIRKSDGELVKWEDTGLTLTEVQIYRRALGEGFKTKVVEDPKQRDAYKESNDGKLPPKDMDTLIDKANIGSSVDSSVKQLLDGYLDYVLGPLSMGIPAAMCGDSIYVKKTDSKQIDFTPFSYPTVEYGHGSDNFMSDMRTIRVEGEKTEVQKGELYRYLVHVSLLFDSSVKWHLYLHDSCTGKDSKTLEIWEEYGQGSKGQIFESLYATDALNLDCANVKHCRFDMACLDFEEDGTHACFPLTGGSGKFECLK